MRTQHNRRSFISFMCFLALFSLNSSDQQPHIGKRHTVISLCGWPQSGTSLAHEIAERLEGTSTMISKCTQINNERNCIGFNYESQWLLKQKDKLHLYSGAMCPLHSSDVTSAVKSSMVSRWMDLWDTNKPYLVSKSPANMMKIPFIHTTLNATSNTRHIVVIKHPASLNIALPKKVSWEDVIMLHDPQNPDTPRQQKGQAGIHFTGKHAMRKRLATVWNSLSSFLNLLQNDEDKMFLNGTSASSGCRRGSDGWGWLSSMGYLAKWLRDHKEFASDNVRILRFEDILDSPLRVCQYFTSFLYNGHQSAHLKIFDKNQGMKASVASARARKAERADPSVVDHKTYAEPYNIMKSTNFAAPSRSGYRKRPGANPRWQRPARVRRLLEREIVDKKTNCSIRESESDGRRCPRGRRNTTTAADGIRHAEIFDTSSSINEQVSTSYQYPTQQQQSRGLRMHMNSDGSRAKTWTFSTYGAKKSCAPRLSHFNKVLQLAKNKEMYHSLVSKFSALDPELRRFGYSVSDSQSYTYTRYETVFDSWDLMFKVRGRRSPEL